MLRIWTICQPLRIYILYVYADTFTSMENTLTTYARPRAYRLVRGVISKYSVLMAIAYRRAYTARVLCMYRIRMRPSSGMGVHTYTCMYRHVYIGYLHMLARVCILIRRTHVVHMWACLHMPTGICVYVYTCIQIHICACACMCTSL